MPSICSGAPRDLSFSGITFVLRRALLSCPNPLSTGSNCTGLVGCRIASAYRIRKINEHCSWTLFRNWIRPLSVVSKHIHFQLICRLATLS
jgi:hypothetical protein